MNNQSVLAHRAFTVKYRGITYAVPSVEAAARKWEKFRDEAMRSGLGPDDVGTHLTVYDSADRRAARISWNGTITRAGETT